MKVKQLRTYWLLNFMLCLGLCSFTFLAGATDRYVSLTGNNTTGNGTQINPWLTISYAVSQATDGDVIRIGAGHFTEQVIITKNLTLEGQGINQTKILSPASLLLSFVFTIGPPPDPSPYYAVVFVQNADNVVIKNLTVDGNNYGNDNTIFTGIGYRNAGGLVDNCQIISIRNNPAYQSQFGYGFFAVADGGVNKSITVSNSKFILFQKLGAAFLGKDLTAIADGNTIEGPGMLASLAQNGIQMSFNATGVIKNNIIKNLTGLAAATATGIFVRDTRSAVLITGNELNNCETSIYCINSTGTTISENKIKFNQDYIQSQAIKPDPVDEYYRWGILVRQGTYTIEKNEVDGGGQGTGIDGFALANETTFINAINNIVKNLTTGISVEVDETPGCVGGEIHYNSITNTEEPLYYLPDPNYTGDCPPPCATCNWYGSANAADFADKFVGGNLFNYTPWLTQGTDTQPDQTGFQPAAINGCSCENFSVSIKSKKDILCYGDDDGAVTIAITGGKAPYTYKLDADDYLPVPSIEFTLQDLNAGDHTIIVKDSKGFTHTVTITIGQPVSPLDAQTSNKIDVKCNGTTTGAITISATGGKAPYTIVGNPGTFASSVTIGNLAAGEHTFTVKDANGCPDQVTVTIAEPSKIVVKATTTPACNGSNGSVIISATGGTPPYTGTGVKNNLAPGTYTFIVKDNSGCEAPISVTIGGTGAGTYNPLPETFPYTFNTGFTKSLYNRSFTGSSGTWTVNSDENGTMVVTTPYYSPSTSHALKVVNFKTYNCNNGWTKAVSPKVNLLNPCCPDNVNFNFTLWTYNVVCNDSKAKLEIDFSNDNGTTWTEVWSKTSGQLWSLYGANGKTTISIPVLKSFQNSNFRYRIRGEMEAGDINNFYVFIDDINFTSPTVCPTPGSIGDYVWNDVNGNGRQDAGEPAFQNVSVKLTLPNGTTQTKTTNASGFYSFTGLAAGNYIVAFTTPAGFTPTLANQGTSDAIDSDPVGGLVSVTLGSGQNITTIDAGFKAITCTNTTSHIETFPGKFNSYFTASLYNKTFVGSSGTWTTNSNSRGTMVVTTPYYSPSSSYALKVVNYNTIGCSAGWTKAMSPKVDLSTPCCPAELKMTFTLWTYKVVANDYKAKLEIDFSANNGANWTEVWSKTSAQLHSSYGANGKTTITISVPPAYQNTNFRYRIRGEMASGDCNNFYVFMDDIKIGSPAVCPSTSSYVTARTSGTEILGEVAPSETALEKNQVEVVAELKPKDNVVVFPNPSADDFELRLSSKESTPAIIRVVDMLGRVIKTMRTAANSSIRFGTEFKRGSYFVEILQGQRKEIVKLVKL